MKALASRIVLSLVVAAIASFCQGKEFVEPDYGFSFTLDEQTWNPVPIPVSTLGEACAVFTRGSQPKELVVVFVRSGTDEQPATENHLKSISQRLSRIASGIEGSEVVIDETTELAGRKALSFRFKAAGSGLAIGGDGAVQTVQHWLVFPRDKDLIVFQVTAPQENFDSAYSGLQEIVKTAKIEDRRPAAGEHRRFADEEMGLAIDYPPSPWIRGGHELGGFLVPGYSLRIWSAPSSVGATDDGESSYANRLALFLQFPGRAYAPQELIDISVPALTSRLGAQVVEQDVRQIAGKKAMWLLVEGKSKTGSAITNSGELQTRQLWVAIPRMHNGNHNIVAFLLNCPAADYQERLAQFQSMLESMEIEGEQ